MIDFTCVAEKRQDVIDFIAKRLAEIIKSTNAQTLAVNHFDADIESGVKGIIENTDNGFVFDKNDLIGEEPYGYVSDFFYLHLKMMSEIKKEFPDVGIDGYVFCNEFGCSDCTMRQRVYCTPEDTDVSYIDQLQCLVCREWVDAEDTFERIYDEETVWLDDETCLFPNCYSDSGDGAVFCICSPQCSEKGVSLMSEDEEGEEDEE